MSARQTEAVAALTSIDTALQSLATNANTLKSDILAQKSDDVDASGTRAGENFANALDPGRVARYIRGRLRGLGAGWLLDLDQEVTSSRGSDWVTELTATIERLIP